MGKTVLPDARVSPRYSGICTFCRYPRVEDVLPENFPLDWAIYGVASDLGVTYRSGARFGPRAIREASQYVKRFHLAHNVDVCAALSMADGSDAPVSPYSIEQTLDLVEEFALGLSEQGGEVGVGDGSAGGVSATKLFAVGGDHSITYANIRASYARQGEPPGGLALVHFDTHLDTVDVLWGEKYSHASVFRRAIEEGYVNPKKMISIGIKGPLNSADDLAFCLQHGVTLATYDEIVRPPSGGLATAGTSRGAVNFAMLDAFVQRVGNHPAYVTFDIDVVDPAFAPGTGTPCPGGFTSAEVLDLLRRLKGLNVVGGDVVEVLPERDPAGLTAFLAAHVMFEIIALDAARRARA